ncbi:MAG: DUF1624 domain-containing protein [bacterium]|nr:DUF1624 domain-containing protein [bacterium]
MHKSECCNQEQSNSTPKPAPKRRIIGLDVARSFAIWGMVIVNYKNALQVAMNPKWMAWIVERFSSRASVTFVVLAGVGISLLSQKARLSDDPAVIRASRLRLAKRSLFLLILGNAFFMIWPGDILHFYAFYMAFAVVFIRVPSWFLWVAALVFCGGAFAWARLADNPNLGAGLYYSNYWTFGGFFRNALFNGFHPVFPWFSFVLVGMWIGRQDLGSQRTRLLILGIALACALTGEFGSRFLMTRLDHHEWGWMLYLRSRPASPFYLAAAVGTAVSVIMTSLILSDWLSRTLPIRALTSTGQLSLTIYLGHVIPVLGGMVILMSFYQMATGTGSGIFGAWTMRNAHSLLMGHTLTFVFGLSVAFYVTAIVFSHLWRKRFRHGPLEWVMRRIAG